MALVSNDDNWDSNASRNDVIILSDARGSQVTMGCATIAVRRVWKTTLIRPRCERPGAQWGTVHATATPHLLTCGGLVYGTCVRLWMCTSYR